MPEAGCVSQRQSGNVGIQVQSFFCDRHSSVRPFPLPLALSLSGATVRRRKYGTRGSWGVEFVAATARSSSRHTRISCTFPSIIPRRPSSLQHIAFPSRREQFVGEKQLSTLASPPGRTGPCHASTQPGRDKLSAITTLTKKQINNTEKKQHSRSAPLHSSPLRT